MDALSDKEYVEASIQTEVAAALSNLARLPNHSPDTSSTSMHSCIEHVYTSPPTMFSFEGKADHSSSQVTIQTTERSLKYRQLVPRRPVGAQTLKSATARIVSLPETASDYCEKKIMEKSRTRVVSMPAINLANCSSQFSDSSSLEHYIEDPEAPSRVRVHSTATEATHTPSPPSSPDSVVFIANRSPLPAGFLRGGRAKCDAPPLSDNEDDGEGKSWFSARFYASLNITSNSRLELLVQIASTSHTCTTWPTFSPVRPVPFVSTSLLKRSSGRC